MYDSWQGLGNVCHQEAGFSAFLFWAPGTRWCDPGPIQGVPGLALVTSLGSVRNAKCWVRSGAIASSTDFIHAFLPLRGISSTGMSTDHQWFLLTEWERKAFHLRISPGTTLIPFPHCIGGWEMYPDKPRIFLISFSFRVTGITSHRVFCF